MSHLFFLKKTSKLLIYSAIIFVTIYIFISIAKAYTAHVYLTEYKNRLEGGNIDIEHQGRLLRKSLRLCPSNAKAHFELGKLYIDENPIDNDSEGGIASYERSKEIFREALALKPTDRRRRAEYAWFIGSNGDMGEAVEQFNMAISLCPTDVYPHKLYAMWCVNQVKEEIDLTDTGQFVEKYRDRQKQDEALGPYKGASNNGVSTTASLLGTSREEWDKALSIMAPKHRYEYKSLADLNLLELELDKAIENYTRAENKYMVARCYIIKGEYGRAVNILAGILKRDGKISRSSLSKTKKLLVDVTNNDPENSQPFYWLGKLHTRLKDTEQAVGHYKESIRLKPGHIDSHLNLAELYNKAGKIDLVIMEYEAILEKIPNHKEATRLLSEALMLEYKDTDFLKNSITTQ